MDGCVFGVLRKEKKLFLTLNDEREPFHQPGIQSLQSFTSHCPSWFRPVATTLPSERKPIVWAQPAATATISFQSLTLH